MPYKGTGKTLVAGALANECSSWDKKFSFFSRKGSDILSKYIGDSEMRLKKLFELAYKQRPSIIFFDELDGLAPPRSDRIDHAHTSIVSVLLAYMDGLGTCDDVFVIGATNRIDRIEPALRRPGRFDRELYFPLPSCRAREAILRVHTERWPSPPPPELVSYLARETSGYCGADLQALCSGAVMHCLKENHPGIYNDTRLKISPNKLKVTREDFVQAKANLVPASQRTGITTPKKLAYFIEPLCQNIVDELVDLLRKTYPHEVFDPSSAMARSRLEVVTYPRLLLTGTPLQGLTSHIGPALLHHFEDLPVYTLDEITLFRHQSPDASCVELLMSASKNLPGVLYLPNVTEWWHLVEETTRKIFLSLLDKLFSNKPLLLLATAHVTDAQVPEQLQLLFSEEHGNIVSVRNPGPLEREHFFFPLFNLSTQVVLPPMAIVDLTTASNSAEPSDAARRRRKNVVTMNGLRKSKRFLRSSRRLQHRPPAVIEPRKLKREARHLLEERRSKKSRNRESKCRTPRAHSLDISSAVMEVNARHVSKSEGLKLGTILDRLVNATHELPVRTLEITYSKLSYYLSYWHRHNQLAMLIQDLDKYVIRLEEGTKRETSDLSEESEYKYSQSNEFTQSVKQEPRT